MKNRLISLIMVFCMAISLFPSSALAEEPMVEDVMWEEAEEYTNGVFIEEEPAFETEFFEGPAVMEENSEIVEIVPSVSEGDLLPVEEESWADEEVFEDPFFVEPGETVSEETKRDEFYSEDRDCENSLLHSEEHVIFDLDAGEITVSEEAENAIIASGTCGVDLTWTLDNTGTLTISGSEEMEDYYDESDTPWYFNRESIVTVIIEDGVTSISYKAFCDCTSLTSVTIPSGVRYIGAGAFYGCTALTNVTIPSSVKHMHFIDEEEDEIGVFEGCTALQTAGPIGSGCNIEFDWKETIPTGAFYGCSNMKSITLPSGLTNIEEDAFLGCRSLEDITIPEGVMNIGCHAFGYCDALTSISIPSSVTSIGGAAFSNCSNLTNVTIPSSVTDIGKIVEDGEDDVYIEYCGVFIWCSGLVSAGPIGSGCNIEFGWADRIPNHALRDIDSLASVVIPEGVAGIGDSAFEECGNLTSVTIPSSLTKTGKKAFKYCDSIQDVYYGGTKEQRDQSLSNLLPNATWHYAELKLEKPSAVNRKIVKTGIKVSWAAVEGAERYFVQRKLGNGKWTKIGYFDGTSFVDKTVKSGKTYKYRVRAHNDTENKHGAYKVSSSVYYVARPKISGIKNTAKGIKLEWGAVAGAGKYRIQRKVGNGGWKKLTDTTDTSYTDTNVKSGTKYSYRVRCIKENGSVVNVYSAAKTVVRLARPVITKTTAAAGKNTVTWKKVMGATSYNVFRKTGNGKYVRIKKGVTKLSFVDKKAKVGAKIRYKIVAVNGTYYSARSLASKIVTAK